MYFAAVALLGASLGQPPAVPNNLDLRDYTFFNKREFSLPVKYKKPRETIRQSQLFFSRDNGGSYELGSVALPDRDNFTFTAKEDGIYWFTMVTEDLQGRKDVPEITRVPPDLKVIIKTTKPRLTFKSASRAGDSIIVEWQIEDKYPNENLTRVDFRAMDAPDNQWHGVLLPAESKNGVKFSAGTLEPIIVRVTAFDMASNKTVETHQFEAGVRTPTTGNAQTPATVPPIAPSYAQNVSAQMPPVMAAPPGPTVRPTTPALASAPPSPQPVPGSTAAPSQDPLGPIAPPPPPSVPVSPLITNAPAQSWVAPGPSPGVVSPAGGPSPSPAPVVPSTPSTSDLYHPLLGTPMPAPVMPTPSPGAMATTTTSSPGPMATISTPSTSALPPMPPVVPPTATAQSSSTSNAAPSFNHVSSSVSQTVPTFEPRQSVVPAVPLGSEPSNGQTPLAAWTGPVVATPAPESPHAQVINFLTFDLAYEVESRGPSGISRLVLWVTRDDGRSWLKWDEQDGKGSSIRVNLNKPSNPQPEGSYGFRVVPVSGAGLSEREPTAGDVPDLRVIVDISPPQVDLFPPVGDPANPDTLVIKWKATDKNWGDDPITIEWSDKPIGPWQPVASGGDSVQTVSGSTTPMLRRLPNTGQYAWHVPSGLSPRVYLKVCARDAAGNVREVITRDPILIDLVKPKAKINGIVPPTTSSLSRQ